MQKHILAASGGLVPEGSDWKFGPIIRYGLSLCAKDRPKICFVTTANGDQSSSIEAHLRACEDERVDPSHLQLFQEPNVPDIHEYLLDQDFIWVSGGSDVNMLALWKIHKVDVALRDAWNSGVVLGGISAGSVCWHSGGISDAYGGGLKPLTTSLGLLPYSNNVHYDASPERRRAFHEAIKSGVLANGYATEDGVALHYVDTELSEALTDTPGRKAYKVECIDGLTRESALPARLII